jgi:hypothetical protein
MFFCYNIGGDIMVKTQLKSVKIKYPEIGICGLSCRFCPHYQTNAKSKCHGCKSKDRMALGCPFITCAVKKKGIEFCFECEESSTCELWKNHRENGKKSDSFVCYQELEANVSFIKEYGVDKFERIQKDKEKLLKRMLSEFDDGRSKSYYCIATTILNENELNKALSKAESEAEGLDQKEKAKLLHSILDDIAVKKGKCIKLRKQIS